LIARATENAVLVMLVDSLSDIIRYVIDKTGRVARPELVPVRKQILKAMRDRDAKAAIRAMNKYLDVVHSGILDKPPIELPPPGKAMASTRMKAQPKRSAKTQALT
jgi:DNA-binding FadR family transcriptional regulator